MSEKNRLTSVGVNGAPEQSITFRFSRSRDMEEAFARLGRAEPDTPAIYARFGHPSMDALASVLTTMEGGARGLCFASGMGAFQTIMHAIVYPGDLVVASSRLYPGTRKALETARDRFGVNVRFVDITDLASVDHELADGARLLVAETVSNPTCVVADVPALVSRCKHHGVWSAFDNTFAPFMITPITHGADLVWHSLTKYASGHSDCLAGGLVMSRDGAARFATDVTAAAVELGATMHPPLAEELIARFGGIMNRYIANSAAAMRLARGFAVFGLPVYYPGIVGSQRRAVFDRVATQAFGYGGVLSVDLGSADRAHRFVDLLADSGAAMCAVSLGSEHTYACVPFSTMSKNASDPLAPEVAPGIVRVSAGHDEPERLWQVFDVALCRVQR